MKVTNVLFRWWHEWTPDDLDELAGSLVAGHLIECSAYVTGGYCAAFKDLIKAGKHVNLGFPIAEIDHRGETVLTKETGSPTGGMVTVDSVASQLLYESKFFLGRLYRSTLGLIILNHPVQGPLYYGSDVVAQLEGIKIENIGEDRVRISGIKGLPPPDTTKVG